MPRYKISVEYDGGPFVGWQRQDTGPSIQASLEDALFAFTHERVHVRGAGRTDSGVHARGQVAHFDLVADKPVEEVRGALNYYLKPNPIAVPTVEIAPPGFHARFSANYRRYRYRILNRRTRAGIDAGFVWHVPVALDLDRMADAASVLIGHHDFNSFRSVSCQAKSAVRTLEMLSVRRDEEEILVDVGARSFLHNQVRILVGTLALVGRGQWSRRDVEEALAARDRARAGPTAPPLGLCLMEVRYGALDAGKGDDAEEPVDDE
ncbi:MAG: tRNA pseudouridine(38-40) synthase TruA [Proteobacteria bacterium]|nr:tRNA pseudouridine(38-40) synthase TruA [Pseudomonadota bacterium]